MSGNWIFINGEVQRIVFGSNDALGIKYPPEKILCNLCNKVIDFKDLSIHRLSCPPKEWKIPMEGDKDE